MKVKKVKRKRLNIARTLVFVLFIYLIVCLCIYIYKEPIRHIEITGESLVNDADIIRSAGLEEYPPFISIIPKKVEKKLKNNPLILDAKVSYGWNFTINIEITPNNPMFIVKHSNTVCLANGEEIDNTGEYLGIPILLNDVPNKIMQGLANKLSFVDEGILYLISEIEYAPSYNAQDQPIEEKRFLLSMSDGNLIYVTTPRVKMLNRYLDIVASPEIKAKGTLYLDGDAGGYVFKQYTIDRSGVKRDEE